MSILDSKYIKEYKSEMIKNMKRMNPEWDENKIEKVIDKMIEERCKNPEVTLDNNYTGEKSEQTLISVFDWILEREPIIAGNGTFYKNQYEAENPIADMLNFFLTTRKKVKKEMFKIEDPESREYKDKDRQQGNWKINANSYYGASGAPSSAFYSVYSGPATTLSAQSVISTAKNFFEGFLADNYPFLNSSECIHWINMMLKHSEDIELDDFINIISEESLVERLYDKIIDVKETDKEMLRDFIDNLTPREITIIYYKNNMIEFIKDHQIMQDIFITIMENVDVLPESNGHDGIDLHGMSLKEYNHYVQEKAFINPNSVPQNIKAELELFKEYIMKYVFTKYMPFDRIYRLRNFKRRVVTTIDTDSNFLSMDILVNWLLDEVIRGRTFGRDKNHNTFIIVNTIVYVITAAIEQIMLFYGKSSNIPKEFRPKYSMKNEFFLDLLVIGKAKKRYISRQVLREGNYLQPNKVDIKGFDFKKATCSDYSEKKFMSIIKNRIINSEEIDLQGMISDIREFEEEIRQSILSGEIQFLPNGSAKELGAYKNPASEQSVRGVIAWNIVEPDKPIELPSKVSLVKMNIFDESDISELQYTNPVIYEYIMNKIFNDTTGIFVERKVEDESINYVSGRKWLDKIPKKYRKAYEGKTSNDWNAFVDECIRMGKDCNQKKVIAKKRGLQVLAIPSNEKIPEWAIPYIDVNTMVNNIISPFKPVLELFSSKFTFEGKTRGGVNRKTEKLTNIVKF